MEIKWIIFRKNFFVEKCVLEIQKILTKRGKRDE